MSCCFEPVTGDRSGVIRRDSEVLSSVNPRPSPIAAVRGAGIP